MSLLDVFAAVAHKELVMVDLPGTGSHQHELNGVAALKQFFPGTDKTKGTIRWHYFADDQEPLQEPGSFTFYDARAKGAARTGRSEWRFYYEGSFLSGAGVGDLLVLARTPDNSIYGLIFQKDSAWARGAKVLFDLQHTGQKFEAVPQEVLSHQEIELLRSRILDELGLEVAVPPAPSDEELVTAAFGDVFPRTVAMSEFARNHVQADWHAPDEALSRWLQREEQLFRALETVQIRRRLAQGFATVDDFLSYSLSVQQRRKSRMGYSLQNHLDELFRLHGLRFKAQARTEGNNKPDFMFPGEQEYHNAAFDTALLTMLGVKSTSKDRWRQVLDEADRITEKHLCTLEPGISLAQTQAMQNRRLTLVIPVSLHATYTPEQRAALLTVAGFIDLVRHKQTLFPA